MKIINVNAVNTDANRGPKPPFSSPSDGRDVHGIGERELGAFSLFGTALHAIAGAASGAAWKKTANTVRVRRLDARGRTETIRGARRIDKPGDSEMSMSSRLGGVNSFLVCNG
jgi:hypothetical protein